MDIISIITLVLTICFGGLALYFKSKTNLIGKISGFIAEAERVYKDSINAGGVKFEFVVNSLYDLVPVAFRGVLSKDTLAKLVQDVFDAIEDYAKIQLDNLLDSPDVEK